MVILIEVRGMEKQVVSLNYLPKSVSTETSTFQVSLKKFLGREGLQKDKGIFLGMMDMFIVLIMVMASQIYTYVKTHFLNVKYLQLIVYQLCLNKAMGSWGRGAEGETIPYRRDTQPPSSREPAFLTDC